MGILRGIFQLWNDLFSATFDRPSITQQQKKNVITFNIISIFCTTLVNVSSTKEKNLIIRIVYMSRMCQVLVKRKKILCNMKNMKICLFRHPKLVRNYDTIFRYLAKGNWTFFLWFYLFFYGALPNRIMIATITSSDVTVWLSVHIFYELVGKNFY